MINIPIGKFAGRNITLLFYIPMEMETRSIENYSGFQILSRLSNKILTFL